MALAKRRIVVLISGSGTNLQAIIDALETPALPATEITLVLSNRKAAYGLTRASQANPPIPTAYLALQPFLKLHPGKTREDYDTEIAKIVLKSKPDIVVLAGWMHILGENFLNILEGKINVEGGEEEASITKPVAVINLHPALPGQFDGANAIERAYEAFTKGKVTKSGAMVHRVVKDVDRGEPVVVREVTFEVGESLEQYETRLHAVEHEIIVQAIKKVLDEVKPVSAMSCSPLSIASSEGISTPFLEVSEIDAVPFSEDFNSLFEGLGLHAQKSLPRADSPDMSYSLENITNLKDISPEWEHDEIEEIVVMSSKRPRSSILPTIREACYESGTVVPSAALSEFSMEPLSQGALDKEAAVFRPCVRRDSGVSYVMKVTKAFTVAASREQAILETLAELRVQFVSQARWIFQETDLLYVVNENYSKGDLLQYVNEHGPLDISRTAFYASELAVALSSLHSAGIVHRALCPSTILFDAQGHLVVSDFTHAELTSSAEFSNGAWDQFPYMPPEYYAPELLLGWSHNGAVDCWSFGMLLCFMSLGSHPFVKPNDLKGNDLAGIYDQILRAPVSAETLQHISSVCRDLVQQCLERNPSVRATIHGIKNHSFFDLVDWEKVSSKQIQIPSVASTSSDARSPCTATDIQKRRMSLILSTPGPQQRYSISSIHDPQMADAPVSSDPDLTASVRASQPFRPSSKILVPSIVYEEDEPVSESEQINPGLLGDEASRANRLAKFWDSIDKEEHGSVMSTPSQEFGMISNAKLQKPPKLRKHRSSIHPRHRLFNISTTSFQMKLRRKPRSTGALRESDSVTIPKDVERIKDLPMGIHQVGSGIGFTYNLPSQAPSKLSVASFAPPCGTGLFSVKGLTRGFGHSATSSRRTKGSKTSVHSGGDPVINNAPLAEDVFARVLKGQPRPQPSREVGNGTFLRDMYHTPSWILSPPDGIPSPIAPVNIAMQTLASPQTDSEPLTPATLVEMNVLGGHLESQGEDSKDQSTGPSKPLLSLSRDAFGELDPTLSPDSTLRLVPPSKSALRLSFFSMDEGDESVF